MSDNLWNNDVASLLNDVNDDDEILQFFTARRTRLGGMKVTCGSLEGKDGPRKIVLTMHVPRCNEKCHMRKTGVCLRDVSKKNGPCVKIVSRMLPVLASIYNQFLDTLDDIDLMNVGVLLVPLYATRFCLYFGVGSWGDIKEEKRQDMVLRYDTKITQMTREFKKMETRK